ncbi:phosphatase PAP2 family protein [Pueribacillus theae]|uniref:phosphatase PAP2 family protein n=1 Tax=Pueribacillus theae TaxID=2171751 RepID=UPI001403156C|nr:phosphatase PAP2 family protein [Pueribacillus theae]
MKRLVVWISLILFIGLAFTFEKPLSVKFDEKILLFFESIRTNFLTVAFYVFTEIGSFKILLPITIIVSIFLIYKKRFIEFAFLMIAFWGVRGVNTLLKGWFERERPSFHSLIEVGGFSFPSGHAMNSTVVFGFLFYLFLHILNVRQKNRMMWLLATIAIVSLIAISRVYLGVHYPTDIVAGAGCGLLYLFIIIYLYQLTLRLKR